MESTFQEIQISEIIDSNTYDIHPFLIDSPCSQSLKESIQLSGIINPPIVIELENGSYDIICGRQRLKNFSNNDTVHCRILSPITSPEILLNLILEDQCSMGSLNLIEQALFLKLCQNLLPNTQRRQKYLKKLPHNRITKGYKYLSQYLSLHQEVQKGIYEGFISEKTLKGLIHFNRKQQLTLIKIYICLHLSGNNQKKITNYFFEISQREGISLEELLDKYNIGEIIDDCNLLPEQKSTLILQMLNKLDHPRLNAAQGEFDNQVNQLNLPKNVQVTHSSAFEVDDVTLSIRFKNFEELKSAWLSMTIHLDS